MAADADTIAKIRLLIPDVLVSDQIFIDDQISTFWELETGPTVAGRIFNAAALALEVAATDEALVLKVTKRLDVQTDGAKLLEAVLKRAAMLRARADKADELEDDPDGLALGIVGWGDTTLELAERPIGWPFGGGSAW